MVLKNIKIENFRALESAEIKFNKGVNLILGDNGVGKTSLLEAIVVSVSSFFSGVTGVFSKGISQEDVRFISHKLSAASYSIEYKKPVLIKPRNYGNI